MSRSQKTREEGWALSATIFALAVILSTMRLLSLQSADTSRIASEIRRTDQLHETIATTVRGATPSSTRCDTLTISFRESALLYEVCREGLHPFKTIPASVSLPQLLVNYDTLFSRASACPAQPKPTVFQGVPSPFMPRDCPLPENVHGSVILLENAVGKSLVLQENGAEQHYLATPGRIVLSRELRVSHDVVVVAGGDVHINAIRGDSPVNVTILSSVGGISVGAIEGEVSLLIAVRGDMNVPYSPPASDYPLPPFRPPSVYSFRATN